MVDDKKHQEHDDKNPESVQGDGPTSSSREYGVNDLSIDEPAKKTQSSEPAGPDSEEETMDAIELENLQGASASGSGAPASSAHNSEHIGHTAPLSLLAGVLVALVLLTILTVGVTAVDLGSEGNFIVAMAIATVKAVLVMGYFMHLFWDSKFNVVVFGSSFLFAGLFFAMTLLDRQETQSSIDKFEFDKKMSAVGSK